MREYIQRGHIGLSETAEAVVKKLLAGAYCRVSTKEESQATSYEAQRKFYVDYIAKHPDWEFAGLYADEQTGTSAKKRKNFTRMINDALAGKLNIIITKSV